MALLYSDIIHTDIVDARLTLWCIQTVGYYGRQILWVADPPVNLSWHVPKLLL